MQHEEVNHQVVNISATLNNAILRIPTSNSTTLIKSSVNSAILK